MMEDFVGIGIVAAIPFIRFKRKLPSGVVLSAPQALLAPKINGTQKEGQTLTATQGLWDDGGSPITSYSFKWLRSGVPITGASTSSYQPTTDDVNEVLQVQVIATNDIGIGVSQSDPTGAIVPADHAPINTALPTIAGIARSEEILAVSSNGEWIGNGDELLDFTYQWNADDVPLDGETGTTINLHDEHIGKRISATVTAINSVGQTAATSLKTAAVIAAQHFPGIVSAPEISGTPKVGAFIWSASTGVWNNGNSEITNYSYQWYSDGVAITGATTNTLSADDDSYEGTIVTCDVTATNAVGSTTATSLDFGPIEARIIAPVNQGLPVITGTLKPGHTVSVDNGTWYDGGAAITYAYQWYKNNGTATAIAGATSDTYDILLGDVGYNLYCVVTATNSAGSTAATTAYTLAVATPDAPINLTKPVITGNPLVGTELSASQGTWDDGGNAISGYTYQWLADGVVIAGATSSTYTPVSGDAGKAISVKVTATNDGGSTTVTSASTAQVAEVVVPEVDPNWDEVTLLLKFDNAGENRVVDLSKSVNTPSTVSAFPAADQIKFGTGSLSIDGSGAVTYADNSAFQLPHSAGDFTIDGWFYYDEDLPNTITRVIFTKRPSSGAIEYQLYVTTAGLLTFTYRSGGSGGSDFTITSNVTITPRAWQFFAVTREGSTYRIFLDGTLIAEGTIGFTETTLASDFSIGCPVAVGNVALLGYLDDFRITKGVARYTADFTPPTKTFPEGMANLGLISNRNSLSVANPTVNVPTTKLLDGDVLIYIAMSPSGFTMPAEMKQRFVGNGPNTTFKIAVERYDSATFNSSKQFTSAADGVYVQILGIRGVGPSTLSDISDKLPLIRSANTSGLSLNLPSANVAEKSILYLIELIGGFSDALGNANNPSGGNYPWTLISNVGTTVARGRIASWDSESAVAGTTGTVKLSVSGTTSMTIFGFIFNALP